MVIRGPWQRPQHYVLLPDHSIQAVDLMTWAVWFEEIDNRRVLEDQVAEFWISTVFLGLDHSFGITGPPILFETMVFDRAHTVSLFGRERSAAVDRYTCRYATWDEAVAGHADAVAMVRSFVADRKQA